jgi:N6-adenosine-specific RNA methylase IME4
MLFGIRGKAPFGDNAQQSWLYEVAGEHSVKPEKIRRIIERCSPGEFLEMFARREVPGWTVWGNEIERIENGGTLFGSG